MTDKRPPAEIQIPKRSSTGKKSAIGAAIVVGLIALRIGLRILQATTSQPDPEFDPDQIDITPVLNQQFDQMNKDRIERLTAGIHRFLETTAERDRIINDRWETARKRGLVDETGVIYVPFEAKPTPSWNEKQMGEPQSTPPNTGWYVKIQRKPETDGSIKRSWQACHPVHAPDRGKPVAAPKPGE